MTRRFCAASAVSLLLMAPAAAHASFSYGTITYTDIADTFVGSPYKQLVSFPAINNGGQVAFSPLSQSNIQSVFVTPTSPGALITVADTAHGFSGMSSVTLNNNAVVAFSGTSSTGSNANQQGVFRGNGGAVTTVADSTTSTLSYYSGGVPRVSDGGSTVFIGYKTAQEVTIGAAGAFTTVVQYNGSQFEYLFDAAINNGGQVVFISDDYSTGNNNGAFVYRYTPGSALVKISRATTSTPVSINDAGVMAFQAATSTGSSFPDSGVFTSDGTTTTAISQAGQNLPGTSIHIDNYGFNGTPINNAGLVAMLASDNAGSNYGIYVGDGTNTATIIHVGQILFGKTVQNFSLGRDAINDNGQLTFNVQFSDNTFAVVRTSGTAAAPEPGFALPLFLSALMLPMFARTRRRVR